MRIEDVTDADMAKLRITRDELELYLKMDSSGLIPQGFFKVDVRAQQEIAWRQDQLKWSTLRAIRDSEQLFQYTNAFGKRQLELFSKEETYGPQYHNYRKTWES